MSYNINMRDYNKYPLQKDKRGHFIERLNYDDVYYHYITLNMSLKECYRIFNISSIGFQRELKRLGIKKDKVLSHNNFIKTCRKKYGVENVFQLDDVKKDINLKKKRTLSKYGVENVFQLDDVKIKANKTRYEKYGNSKYCNPEKISKTLKKYFQSNVFKLKKDSIVKKCRNTRIKNGTLCIINSKEEQEIYNLLKLKYKDVIHCYTDERYPFNCDFYIPSKDLFIEYQGYISHGKEPYIGTKEQDMLVNKWEKLSVINTKKYNIRSNYQNYIYTWTVRDVLKRKTAKDNNLNWIEFFNKDDFMKWYVKQ